MSFLLIVGLMLAFAFAVAGLLIWFSRNVPVTGTNRRIARTIGILQAAHVLLYFTGLLDVINRANVYAAFAICAATSLICLALSVWILLPFSRFRHGIRFLFLLLAVLQVLITIWMFLLPEAGIPAPIQF